MTVFYFIVVAFVFYLQVSLFDQVLDTEAKEWMGYAGGSLDVFIYVFICGLFNDILRFFFFYCLALNMRIIVHSEFGSRWKKVVVPQFKAFDWDD